MSKRAKRILIIGPFPNPLTGLNISNAVVFDILNKNGFCVDSIDMEINRELDESIGRLRIYKFKTLLNYLKLYKVFQNDIIYCTIGQSFFGILKYAPFLVIATLFSKKKVAHLHGNSLRHNYLSFGFTQKTLAYATIRMFDKAIVLSNSMKSNFKSFINDDKVFVCHNFVALEEISHEVTAKKSHDIVFLSNLIPSKGIQPFLVAVEKLAKEYSAVNVHVAGALSSDYLIVEDYMRKLPNVTYHGVVKGSQKSQLLLNADIFCLPTLNQHEGQPLSILEAMASGCYIIASNVKGISDILNFENGELLPVVNADTIFTALKNALKSTERLSIVQEYNRCYSAQFSLEKFEKNIIPLITE